MAEASGRILLIHHQRPMPLTELLAPRVLDWVPKPEEVGPIMDRAARVSEGGEGLSVFLCTF